jgi:hypothetical protein
MKRLKYMAVSHTIKEDGEFKILQGQHICGCRMLFCTTCKNIFCTNCDFVPPKKIPKCCSAAVDAYAGDNERKFQKREAVKRAISKRPRKQPKPKPPEKFKIKLEEIPCDNKL